MVAVAKRVCSSVKIPVIIDADTGYGNALNVIRTVNELIDAGAAGMFLEDQVWPKRCGHMKGKRVIPVEEHVQKVRAAVDARRGRDFFIVARTDARQVNGLEDAIKRCRKYKEAGADALFIEAPRSGEELKTIAKELPPPLVANMLEGGVTPLLTKDELEKIGLQLIVCPLTALYASAKAMQELFNRSRLRAPPATRWTAYFPSSSSTTSSGSTPTTISTRSTARRIRRGGPMCPPKYSGRPLQTGAHSGAPLH